MIFDKQFKMFFCFLFFVCGFNILKSDVEKPLVNAATVVKVDEKSLEKTLPELAGYAFLLQHLDVQNKASKVDGSKFNLSSEKFKLGLAVAVGLVIKMVLVASQKEGVVNVFGLHIDMRILAEHDPDDADIEKFIQTLTPWEVAILSGISTYAIVSLFGFLLKFLTKNIYETYKGHCADHIYGSALKKFIKNWQENKELTPDEYKKIFRAFSQFKSLKISETTSKLIVDKIVEDCRAKLIA